MNYYYDYPSPIGILHIVEEDGFLVGVHLADWKEEGVRVETPLIREADTQLTEYFLKRRTQFNLPIRLRGTPFQETVWEALRTIPYGETVSYGEIARQIGRPKASRAVGGANHKNPLLIVVPCHRVIGANKSLTGFGAGLLVKKYLLDLEKQ